MSKKAFPFIYALLIFISILSGCTRSKVSDTTPVQDATSPSPPSADYSITPFPYDYIQNPSPSGSPSQPPPNNDNVTHDVFKALSSQKLKGRVMGSPGGEKARDIISRLFTQMGLEPFHENFESSVFMNQGEAPASSITLNIEGMGSRSLMASEDYFSAPGKAFAGEYRVVYKDPVKDGEKVIFIVDEENVAEISGKSDQAAGYIHLKSPLFRSVARGASAEIELFVRKEILDELKYYDGKATMLVDLPETANIVTVDGSNVIGYLPGKNSDECLVISAHYDGEDDETAALDNASGVYTMLKTAEKLSSYYKEHEPERDIIFAGFDGEEQGLIGSGYLADELKERYGKAAVINLDCVGIKGSDSYMVIGDASRFGPIIDSLYGQLNDYDFGTVPVTMFYGSDHLSFEWQDIPAVTIGERDVDGIVHTPNDVAAGVDTGELDRLSDAVVSYVLEKADGLY